MGLSNLARGGSEAPVNVSHPTRPHQLLTALIHARGGAVEMPRRVARAVREAWLCGDEFWEALCVWACGHTVLVRCSPHENWNEYAVELDVEHAVGGVTFGGSQLNGPCSRSSEVGGVNQEVFSRVPL